MWEAQSVMMDKSINKFYLLQDGANLHYEEVIHCWVEDHKFREFYISLLSGSRFEAFFWEHPAVTSSDLDQAYEFVLVNSPQLLDMTADPEPFSQQFNSSHNDQSIIASENLGRDAKLIVPRPLASKNIYAHFATFIRHAPDDQKHALFITLGKSLSRRIGDRPTWVSTSGLGVYWLHIRLDTRPKYYSYPPYKQYTSELSNKSKR